MNARTAKLIRKYCAATSFSRKSTKRAWNSTPKPEKHQNRLAMKQELE